MGLLGPLLNSGSELLYKQLIHPLMDYVCPAWWSATRTHVWRLQVLQSKCLCLVTCAPWYLSNRQIHENLFSTIRRPHERPNCVI
jgi:4-amino-4-deoxy-L-arabinose transferase-like glycosyltransferase